MARFLPWLLVLILIFGVHPLQFMLITAIVLIGMGWRPGPLGCPHCSRGVYD